MGFSDGWDPVRPGAVAGPGESVFSDAVAQEICAAVMAGRSVRAFCAEPGRPHRMTVRNWRKTYPDFGDSLGAAYLVARSDERRRDRAAQAERRRALAAAAEARAAGAGSSGSPLAGSRGRGGRESAYTPELGEAVCARLEAGESLTSIGKDPDMPSYGVVLKWVREFPAFEARYVRAREVQGDFLFDEARDVAKGVTKETVPVARLQFDVIRWQSARLAPKKYLERIVGAEAKAAAEAAARAADDGAKRVIFHATHFEIAPDGKTVLAAPPRNVREAEAWVTATGRPYAEGVGPKGQIRPPPIPL